MSLTLNTGFSSIDQLHEINRMAHSAALKTSGNIGLIGSQIVKFNTHLSERLFSKPTAEMFESSRAMRETLRGLIGDVLSGPGDAKLKDKLLAKLDAGGDHSLLERKVVAKVLDELGQKKGLEGVLLKDAKAEVSASSRGVATDFANVRIRAQVADANWIFDLRDEFAAQIKDVANNFGSILTSKEVGFTPDQMRTFNVMVADFAKELAKMNVSRENPHPVIPQKDLIPRFVYMVRVASGKEMSSVNDILKPFLAKIDLADMAAIKQALKEGVNGSPADCFVELARGRTRDAAMLMAHFDFMTSTDVELVNAILSKTKSFVEMSDLDLNEPLTRDKIHELLVGQPPDKDTKLDALSPSEFSSKLNDAYLTSLEKRCEQGKSNDQLLDPANVRGAVNGTYSVTVSEENAIKMRSPHKEPFHFTEKDILAKGPGYNLELLKKETPESASRQLLADVLRFRHAVKFIGGDLKPNTVNDFKPAENMTTDKKGNVKLSEVGKNNFNELHANLKKLASSEKQRLVVEFLLTQASLPLTNVFPLSVTGPSKAIPSFTVTKFDDSDTLCVHAEMKGVGGRTLSFSYSVESDGNSNLFELDYTAPADA